MNKLRQHSPTTDLKNIERIFFVTLLVIDFYMLYPVIAHFIAPSQQRGITEMILYTAFYITPLAVINVVIMIAYLLLDRPKGGRRFVALILLLLFGAYLVYTVYTIAKPY